jgi:hypothetical protein
MKKNYAYGALVASGLVTLGLGLAAPAWSMPVVVDSPEETVNKLESEGFTVILNKVGSAALHDCTVTAVRPGQTYIRTDSGVPGAGNDFTFTELSKTVYVDVKC